MPTHLQLKANAKSVSKKYLLKLLKKYLSQSLKMFKDALAGFNKKTDERENDMFDLLSQGITEFISHLNCFCLQH